MNILINIINQAKEIIILWTSSNQQEDMLLKIKIILRNFKGISGKSRAISVRRLGKFRPNSSFKKHSCKKLLFAKKSYIMNSSLKRR